MITTPPPQAPVAPAVPALLLLLGALLLFAGCTGRLGGGDAVMSRQAGDRAVLATDFSTSAYWVGTAETSIYASDVPLETLLDPGTTSAQVIHVDLLWRPVPGKTPLARESTNASIRHVIVVDGEIGVYGGAGFARIRGKPGETRLTVRIRAASMALLRATPGFKDRLTPAGLDADLVAVLDPLQARRIRQAISQRVTDAFEEPMFVMEQARTPWPEDRPDALGSALVNR